MVSEANTGRCASKKAEPQKRVDTKRCARENVGVDWKVPHQLEKETSASEDAELQRG